MNTPDFLKILHQPDLMKIDQVDSLEEVVNSFPYFQAARVLYLKGLKNQNSFRYNLNLKTTAAYTTDRSVLFQFITSDTFGDSFEQKKEDDFIESIELVDMEVIKNIENETSAILIKKEVDNFIEENRQLEEKKNKTFHFEIAEDEQIDDASEENSVFNDVDFQDDLVINFEPVTKTDILSASTEETFKEEIVEAQQEETPILEKFPKKNIEDRQKPVHFQKGEMHSFIEWLQLSSFKPIDRSKEPDVDPKKVKKQDLIDRFIITNPKISKISNEPVNTDLEANDELETDAIMTETLAHLYEQQKKYNSAIKAYEILGLKFPEKSSFFADQIKRLKKLSKK